MHIVFVQKNNSKDKISHQHDIIANLYSHICYVIHEKHVNFLIHSPSLHLHAFLVFVLYNFGPKGLK